MEKVYIFGHKNPDTDAVCGTIALTYLKKKLGLDAEPRILSNINPETEYALKRFNVEVPPFLYDVRVQLKDVNFHKNYLFAENRSIAEAFNYMMENNITGLPLIDDAHKLKGYVSLKEIASDLIYNAHLTMDTSLHNILELLHPTDKFCVDEWIKGEIVVLLEENSNQMLDNCNEDNIVIMGRNWQYLEQLIQKKVQLIIVAHPLKLTSEIKSLAQKMHVNIICSNLTPVDMVRKITLANPINSIKRSQSPITFNANDYLADFNETTSRLKHTNYPIVDNHNHCLGMLRTIDAHEVKRKKVILVDHNMLEQSVDGLAEAEILEIIDHHNIGDINTTHPINFRNMSVGSVNTIIYYLYHENKIKIPKNIAGIMLSGILSDTLLLESPTTTNTDRLIAKELANIAGVNLKQYGLELLSSGVAIDNLTANQILHKDLKTYKVGDYKLGIAQVFTTDFNVFKPRLNELITELNQVATNYDYKCLTLFVTNFLTNNSYLLFAENSKKILELAYGKDDIKEAELLHGVVSRKKQIVPNIMSVMEHL